MATYTIEPGTLHAATGAGVPIDGSVIHGNWILVGTISNLTAAAGAAITVQESLDGFVTDIRTLMVQDLGPSTVGSANITQSITAYDRPTGRLGSTGCQLRTFTERIDAGASFNYTVVVNA
jgi:hypothetical protein